MCGIIGYVGEGDAPTILIDGLKRLEYRGYDSAGIAVIFKDELFLRRCKGKVADLEKILRKEPVSSSIGIGHTRWATHGKPSEENAHPHTDCKNEIVLIHNGIIENHMELKQKLKKEGHKFKSETDTEIIVHLIEKFYTQTKDLLNAVSKAIKELKGSYAIGVLTKREPDRIVAARKESPLIVGLGKGENFIASDIPAVLPHTREVVALDDGEVALIKKDKVEIFKNGKKIKKKSSIVPWDPVMAEKEGFKHFMLKEIFEQPRAIQDTLRGRYNLETGEVSFEFLNLSDQEIKNFKKIFIVACGTAYHAGVVGKFLIENLAKIPVEVDIGSEFRYRNPLITKADFLIIISQSGETADTLASLRLAKKKKVKSIAICNVVGSSATRESDGVVYTHAGPEIGVASTKAFTTQLTVLYLLSIYIAMARKSISKSQSVSLLSQIIKLPHRISDVLKSAKQIEELAHRYFKKKDFLYLGRNINYPIALEGALKLKEISYIHAEGYPAGEMKHGPIALIDEEMPVVVIATKGSVYEKVISNIQEAKTRGGIIISIATKGDKAVKKFSDDVIFVPQVDEKLSPIINVIPLQLLAYYVALLRGCDIDQPRNLAKSVVVE